MERILSIWLTRTSIPRHQTRSSSFWPVIALPPKAGTAAAKAIAATLQEWLKRCVGEILLFFSWKICGCIMARRAFYLSREMETSMINFLGCSAQGIAVANGVTTLALLEHMVDRKMLTHADVRTILGSGIECLEPRINVRTVAEAVHLMRDQMLPLFEE